MKQFCRLYEKDGYYYLSDKYDLRILAFHSAKDRQRWMDDFYAETGKELVVLPFGPIEDRSEENLQNELAKLDALAFVIDEPI